jgi:hypothetical protein
MLAVNILEARFLQQTHEKALFMSSCMFSAVSQYEKD